MFDFAEFLTKAKIKSKNILVSLNSVKSKEKVLFLNLIK